MDKKLAIQQIVNLPAWEIVEGVIKEEIMESKKAVNFKTEGKTAEMIALEVIARKQSADTILSALRKINNIGKSKEFKKESYR